MDWTACQPLKAEGLLALAGQAVGDCRPWVKAEARVSHVGLRSRTQEQWQDLLALMAPYGAVRMTFKPDGRPIPFVQLHVPRSVGVDVLEYIEIPAPKPVAVDEPNVLVAFQDDGGSGKALLKGGYDIREQPLHARDYIERDKDR